MNGHLIEWLASLSAVLFGCTAVALSYRVFVNVRSGVRAMALRNQVAVGGVLLFAALALSEGRRWLIWHLMNGGIGFREATAGTLWAFVASYWLALAGGLVFVRAVTVEDCGEKVWLSALGIAVAAQIALGALR